MIKDSNFEEVRLIDEEGLVLLGCSGDLQECVYGVAQDLLDKQIATPGFKIDNALKITYGDRIDLVLLFDWDKVNLNKLIMWRLQSDNLLWLSDYINSKDSYFPDLRKAN